MNGKLDLVLIVPFQEKATFGPRIVDSYLTQHGFEVAVLFLKKRDQLDSVVSPKEERLLIDFIADKDPRLIGFSVMTVFRNPVIHLTQKIRDKVTTPIIWGGVHAMVQPDDCMLFADICCAGEGEEPLRLILEQLRHGPLSTDIPNCYFKKDGKVIKNPITYVRANLDDLPPPDLSGKNKFHIENNKLIAEDPYVTHLERSGVYDFKAFRGCPYRCTYCGNEAIWNTYSDRKAFLRKRSVDNVITELENVVRHFPTIKSINSFDETFISDRKWVKEFAEKYAEAIHLPFSCDMYITQATEAVIKDLVKAGLTEISVGIESFNEEIRRTVYKRNQKDSTLLEKIDLFHKYNVTIGYDFILDNPYETGKDLKSFFFNFILKLPRPGEVNLYSLGHLPETVLTERLLGEGLISESDVVGISDKGLLQWKATDAVRRDPEIEFWSAMMRLYMYKILIGKRIYHVPTVIIRLIGKINSPIILRFAALAAIAVTSASDGTLLQRIIGRVERLFPPKHKHKRRRL